MHFCAIIREAAGQYIGSVPTLPGVQTSGLTQAEVLSSLKEGIRLFFQNSKNILNAFPDKWPHHADVYLLEVQVPQRRQLEVAWKDAPTLGLHGSVGLVTSNGTEVPVALITPAGTHLKCRLLDKDGKAIEGWGVTEPFFPTQVASIDAVLRCRNWAIESISKLIAAGLLPHLE